ncbi:MAG: hypothetical protein Q9180_005732, partial [Flavoplaca navasiana]
SLGAIAGRMFDRFCVVTVTTRRQARSLWPKMAIIPASRNGSGPSNAVMCVKEILTVANINARKNATLRTLKRHVAPNRPTLFTIVRAARLCWTK